MIAIKTAARCNFTVFLMDCCSGKWAWQGCTVLVTGSRRMYEKYDVGYYEIKLINRLSYFQILKLSCIVLYSRITVKIYLKDGVLIIGPCSV